MLLIQGRCDIPPKHIARVIPYTECIFGICGARDDVLFIGDLLTLQFQFHGEYHRRSSGLITRFDECVFNKRNSSLIVGGWGLLVNKKPGNPLWESNESFAI